MCISFRIRLWHIFYYSRLFLDNYRCAFDRNLLCHFWMYKSDVGFYLLFFWGYTLFRQDIHLCLCHTLPCMSCKYSSLLGVIFQVLRWIFCLRFWLLRRQRVCVDRFYSAPTRLPIRRIWTVALIKKTDNHFQRNFSSPLSLSRLAYPPYIIQNQKHSIVKYRCLSSCKRSETGLGSVKKI